MAAIWKILSRTSLRILTLWISIGVGYFFYSASSNRISDPSLPKFELVDLESESGLFSDSDLPSTPFLINAWASWCAPCRTEYPTLQDLKQRNVVEIYGLNYKDNQFDAMRWLEFYGSIYSKNGYDSNGDISNALNITVVPSSILFNARQEIVYKHVGPLTDEVISNILVPSLKRLQNEELDKQ